MMKKIFVGLFFAMLMVAKGSIAAAEELAQPFAKGGLNPYNRFFMGTTYLSNLVSGDAWQVSVSNVTFEKGARTNWHYHTGGQILLVTAGSGRYQEKGKALRILQQGDVIQVLPNTIHWHGAAPDCELAHIAIMPNKTNNQTIWLAPVTNEEYH